jgi:hypothetical protein
MAKSPDLKVVESKPIVTFIEFVREQGVQIVQPNGDFLRHARLRPPTENSSNKSDFHVIGIADVEVLPNELCITLTSGIKRYFPKQAIASYTVE